MKPATCDQMCPVCQQVTLHIINHPTNHLMHAILTVLTCGCWSIIWVLRACLGPKPSIDCTVCNHVSKYN